MPQVTRKFYFAIYIFGTFAASTYLQRLAFSNQFSENNTQLHTPIYMSTFWPVTRWQLFSADTRLSRQFTKEGLQSR